MRMSRVVACSGYTLTYVCVIYMVIKYVIGIVRVISVRLLSDWLSNETGIACVSDVCTCLMGVWLVEG